MRQYLFHYYSSNRCHELQLITYLCLGFIFSYISYGFISLLLYFIIYELLYFYTFKTWNPLFRGSLIAAYFLGFFIGRCHFDIDPYDKGQIPFIHRWIKSDNKNK
jgi:hypothetical protein